MINNYNPNLNKKISFSLPQEVFDKLEIASISDNKKISVAIRDSISSYIEDSRCIILDSSKKVKFDKRYNMHISSIMLDDIKAFNSNFKVVDIIRLSINYYIEKKGL